MANARFWAALRMRSTRLSALPRSPHSLGSLKLRRVAGDDGAVFVNQDRVGPAELAYAGGDLLYLFLRVRARVAL